MLGRRQSTWSWSRRYYKNFVSGLKSVYQVKQKHPNLGQKLVKSLLGGSLANSVKKLNLRRLQKILRKEIAELNYAIKSGASVDEIKKEAEDVKTFLQFTQYKLPKGLRKLKDRTMGVAKNVVKKASNTRSFF